MAGVVLAGSSVVFTLAWMMVVKATQISEPPPPGNYMVESLDPTTLVIDSFRFLAPFGEGPLIMPSVWFLMAMSGSALAVWAGLARPQGSLVRQLAPGFLLGAALSPIVLDLMVFLTTDQYIGIHIRYGLAIFPLGSGSSPCCCARGPRWCSPRWRFSCTPQAPPSQGSTASPCDARQ